MLVVLAPRFFLGYLFLAALLVCFANFFTLGRTRQLSKQIKGLQPRSTQRAPGPTPYAFPPEGGGLTRSNGMSLCPGPRLLSRRSRAHRLGCVAATYSASVV